MPHTPASELASARATEAIAARARHAIDELSGGDLDTAATELQAAALATTRLAAGRRLVDEDRDAEQLERLYSQVAGEDFLGWTGIAADAE